MRNAHKKFEDELRRKQLGYVMINNELGIEIKCTEKYRMEWEKRGFVVKEKKMISLID